MLKASSMDVRSESIRSALLEIANANGGRLNVDTAIEIASDPSHILHDYLEWDDTAAGAEYRRAQMGCLIRRVKFHVMREDAETKTVNFTTVRMLQSRPSMRHAEGGYEPIEDIMVEDAKRQELLKAAYDELEAFVRKYEQLEELSLVFKAVRSVRVKKAAKTG